MELSGKVELHLMIRTYVHTYISLEWLCCGWRKSVRPSTASTTAKISRIEDRGGHKTLMWRKMSKGGWLSKASFN